MNDCYPEKTPRAAEELLADTISLEQYIGGINARGFDKFVAGKDRIIVDTTDFSKVDIFNLVSQVEEWRAAQID